MQKHSSRLEWPWQEFTWEFRHVRDKGVNIGRTLRKNQSLQTHHFSPMVVGEGDFKMEPVIPWIWKDTTGRGRTDRTCIQCTRGVQARKCSVTGRARATSNHTQIWAEGRRGRRQACPSEFWQLLCSVRCRLAVAELNYVRGTVFKCKSLSVV